MCAANRAQMAKEQYLQKRRQGWYFVMAVPRSLHGKPPWGHKTTIVKSLKTGDPIVARKLRWPLVNEWKQAFERAATGEPLSRAEIDAQARECYQSSLERMDADRAWHQRPYKLLGEALLMAKVEAFDGR